MKADLKDRWLEALRSGSYQQGTGRLLKIVCGTMRYCCLGVLANISDLENKDTLLRHKAGFNDAELELLGLPQHHATTLVELNDTFRKPFNIIADYIEKNL